MTVLAQSAVAACNDGDIRDYLSPADLTAVESAAADTPFGTGTIWTATRDDDQITVVGTLHLSDPRLAPIVARLTPAITDADLLLVEAGPQEEAQLTAAITEDPSLIFLTDGTTLSERMDPAAFVALSRAVEARGLPAATAAQMKPWYLSLTLAMPVCAQSDLLAGKRGLDATLMDLAAAANVTVQAVEAWDTLFNILAGDPIDEQVADLNLALMPDDLGNAMTATMLDSYFAGDIATLWELSRAANRQIDAMSPVEADALFAKMETQMLTDRNHGWMPVITDAVDAHDRIVLAVGAAHLPGTDGVLSLLQADGWTVTPGL